MVLRRHSRCHWWRTTASWFRRAYRRMRFGPVQKRTGADARRLCLARCYVWRTFSRPTLHRRQARSARRWRFVRHRDAYDASSLNWFGMLLDPTLDDAEWIADGLLKQFSLLWLANIYT